MIRQLNYSLLTRNWIPINRLFSTTSRQQQNLVNVTVNDKTGIAVVEMNKPPVNSLNLELLTALSNTFDDLDKNRTKGMILTSSSKSVFSGGLDILEMYKPDPERAKRFWTTLQDVWVKLYGSAFPTAAAINGHSPAGGCLLAMSCEYRVMCPNFTIGLNETKLGIIAPKWFMATMANILPTRLAEKSLTLGTMYSTDEAFKIGLIDELANDKQDAIEKCEQFLLQFKNIARDARAVTKQTFRSPALMDLENNREQDVQMFLFVINQPKVQKGLEMYLESLKKK